MTTTITTPAPYSSVRKPVMFSLDRPTSAVCEVAINGHRKLLSGATPSVNAAHYYEANFDARPGIIQQGELKLYGGREANRVVDAHIFADGVRSDDVPLLDADIEPSPARFMSDLRRRIVAAGDMDEISVYLESPAVLTYGSEQIALEAGVSFVALRIPEDAPERFAVSLLAQGGEVLDRIDYQVADQGGVRLAWVNAYGAIDFWTFENRRKTAVKVSKTRIYSDRGYIPISVQAETTHTICSQPLPEQVLAALCRIFMAGRVWVMESGEARSIDVTTDSTTTYEAEKPNFIQVEYRDTTRQL